MTSSPYSPQEAPYSFEKEFSRLMGLERFGVHPESSIPAQPLKSHRLLVICFFPLKVHAENGLIIENCSEPGLE